ncbi:uncharacterized protein LOC100570368 [Acyrthosiphon pisum]|uniref:MYND-type domain-containing protein n=1 Tax=Acyrthosiphon pisum TaxID=7029 RepID=A0A8R2JUM3_ACYPI|nr:uncharacterized protein LOC100570368 [Acyrthosiphon pisum]
MMDADQCTRWLKMINFVQKPNHQINSMKLLADDKLSTIPKENGVKPALKVNKMNREYLIKIEKLYKKYFCKSVIDTIVIIANIINIIELSNQYHKERINKSLNKRTEAEKLKERYDASRLNERHKRILGTKFKKNFKDVVSSFEDSEFDLAFQMFFLSILSVHQALKQPKLKKGSIFRNLVLLLKDNLDNSEYPQIFSLFNSMTFRPNCIDLITKIEDNRVIDPEVVNRMPLFFEPSNNSLEYFQAVIKAATTDSKEDLEILIDNATSQCFINSIFKDPVDSSTVTETIQSTLNSNKIIQQWFLTKNPDGTYQKMAVVNVDKSETICKTEVKPLSVTNQSSNQSFSSPLQEKTYVSSTSKEIPTKKGFVATSTNSHDPLMQVTAPLSETTTLMPTATTLIVVPQPPMQDEKSVANSHLHRAEDGTNVLDVQQDQLVKVSTGQMKAEVDGNNPQTEPTVLNNTAVVLKPISFLKCHARNCINAAILLCIKCQAVQYCSNQCQEHDFYDCHRNICEQLQNIRRAPQ